MATVRIRPYSSEDYRRLAKNRLITNAGNAANASASSQNIFGAQGNKADKNTKQKSADTFHMLGVIQMALPIPNYFVCEKDLSFLEKIMRPGNFDKRIDKRVTVKTIMDCTFIYNMNEGRFINANNELRNYGFYNKDFLIGAQCLEYFMSRFDVDAEIKREIASIAGDVSKTVIQRLGLKKIKSEFERIEVLSGDDVWEDDVIYILDDYYVRFIKEFNDTLCVSSVNTDEAVINCFRRVLDERVYPKLPSMRISYLLNMRKDEYYNNFRNMIQSYMALLPIGFRKGIDGKQSPITKAYNNLISANENLKSLLRQNNVELLRIITAYKELIRNVKYVVSDSSVMSSGAIGYKSFLESLTGKHGIVREHLQSVTVDNSGRTVIIGNTEMSIDSIGIPYRMLREMCDVFYVMFLNLYEERHPGRPKLTPKEKLKKLKEFKSDAEFNKTKEFLDRLCDTPDCKKDGIYHILREICPVFMMTAGRQPTLWKYGIQAFRVVPVDGMAIQLAPLCVVAFNADFDGDQMHTSIAVSLKAQLDLVNKLANVKNIYLSRDGSCHIYPRHEIIYGLWYASTMKPTGETVVEAPKLTNEIKDMIFDMIKENKAPLDSKVVINGHTWSLGQMAVKCCAGVDYADYTIGDMKLRRARKLGLAKSQSREEEVDDGVCTDKWCKALLTKMYDESVNGEQLFIETINNYTVIGTRIATNYPPDINLMNIPDISSYLDEFEKAVKKSQRYYNLGLETYDGYARTYAEEYNKMAKKIENDLLKNKASGIYLGDDNGYKLMKDSGCRGSASTIMQMFGLKGRMQRNSNETFNAIVKNSMSHGLTGLEHMVCAYGGRQGQIDKSLETATPGYIYRTLLHAMCNLKITDYDCGTTNGMLIDMEFLEFVIGNGSLREDLLFDKAKEVFYKMVEGRYIIEKPDGIITQRDTRAENGIFETHVCSLEDDGRGGHRIRPKGGIHLRSPITCDNPCCARCYGYDLSKHKMPQVGHAIGMEGAQSISEPLAQLILKNFQKGGVAGEGGLTSAFDIISAYIELRTVDKPTRDKPRFYDVVSPYSGEVEYMDMGNGIRHIFINSNGVRQNSEPYVLYNNVPLKSYVNEGEGIMLETGNFILDEVTEIKGIDYTIRYLAVKLWQIFSDQDVNLRHFETLVASMIFFNCIKSVDSFEAGKAYSLLEYKENYGFLNEDCFRKVLYSVKKVPRVSNDILRGLMFEQQVNAMATHVLKNDMDSLKDIYVRSSLGLDLDLV